MCPDPGDVGRLERFAPPQRNIEGDAGFIHRVFDQPRLEPPRRLAQLLGGFIKGQGLHHFSRLFWKIAASNASFATCLTKSRAIL
jgi:hypothetical protein